MKVFLKYEDNDDESTHKTLKITLPKSWKTGPTSRLLEQFVESYNGGKQGESNALDAASLHLAVRRSAADGDDDAHVLTDLASDDVVAQKIPDREDVYICHGPSRTLEEINAEKRAILEKEKEEKEAMKNLSRCIHFGCQQRFPKGGPYPECKYHSGPPVFHETAKFWSCCPHKKAFDWEQFQSLPTCQEGRCTDVKEEGEADQKQFLGGCDIREKMNGGPKLKSIDDFNASAAAGGSDGAPMLERLRSLMEDMGVENELFDQVVDGIKSDVTKKNAGADDAAALDETVKVLGGKLKNAMKIIAVEQLRIS